jgi:hypothetical protein
MVERRRRVLVCYRKREEGKSLRLLVVTGQRTLETIDDLLAPKRSVGVDGRLLVGKRGNDADRRPRPGDASEQRIAAGDINAATCVAEGWEAGERE